MIISFSGNIASGKSTIINFLKQKFENNPNVCFIDEPLEEWLKFKCDNGKTLFANYYENQKAYAFKFQLVALLTRLNKIKETIDTNKNVKIFIVERSPYDDRFIFAETLHQMGCIPNEELIILDECRKILFDSFFKIDKIFFLDVAAQKCFDRLHVRNREAESEIPLDFLKLLEQNTKKFLENREYLTVDTSKDVSSQDYQTSLEELSNLINSFLNV